MLAASEQSMPRRTFAGYLFAGLLALYTVLGLNLANAPLQDLPNHLTRAHVIADLLFAHGAIFGRVFSLKLTVAPYLGGDLALATLDQLVGTAWACRLWIVASLVLLPLSACFAARRSGVDSTAASAAGILVLYLATDSFFVMGFLNYQLGVACGLFAYGWYRTAVRTRGYRASVYFVLLALVSYSLHPSALLFVLAIAAAHAVLGAARGNLSLRYAAALLFVPSLLLLWQLAQSSDAYLGNAGDWGTWQTKLNRVAFLARRFDRIPDLVLLAAFLAVAAMPFVMRRARGGVTSVEALLLAAMLFGSYIFMPVAAGGAYDVDVRALPYALLFVLLAGVSRAQSVGAGLRRVQLTLAVVIAVVNLGYIATRLIPQNAAMGRYRTLTALIPAGARVLPIDTLPPIGPTNPFLHAGAFATLDAAAMTPYVFAADRNPHFAYFVYRDRPYAPSEFWYNKFGSDRVFWERVASEYQYLLVTVPWRPDRISVAYTTISRNSVAELLAVHGQKSEH
jgi:hypothetical protein